MGRMGSAPEATLSSFIGRGAEISEVGRLLEERRLVTLTGPGGAGKTRLALELSARYDGRLIVELAELEDGALVAPAILDALGVREQPAGDMLALAAGAIGAEQAILVLDNCEHLLEAAGEAVQRLLAACPALRALATSRAPLGVAGETTWGVPPLSDAEAAALFTARADEVRPGAAWEPATVARLCGRLDGMPLAIELAAARLRMLSAEEIADGLDDRLRLLSPGTSTVDGRRRTLRGSIDWSHDLLADPERVLFRRLSVFAGGCDLVTAEAVCAAPPLDRDDVLDAMGALVNQSLVVADTEGEGSRFRLLESMRAYGAERLEEAGETGQMRARHLEVLRDRVMEVAERGDIPDIGSDEGNVRAALAHGLVADPASALHLAVAVSWSWVVNGRYAEGHAALEDTLAAARDRVSATERAVALATASFLAHHAGASSRAEQLGREALEAAEAAGDPRAVGLACTASGIAVEITVSPMEALPLHERAVETLRGSAPDSVDCASALISLGICQMLCDLFEEAARSATATLRHRHAADSPWIASWGHAIAAWSAVQRGRLRDAVDRSDRAVELNVDSASLPHAVAYASRITAFAYLGDGRARDEAVADIAQAKRRGAVFVLPRLHYAAGIAELACGDAAAAAARASGWIGTGYRYMAAAHQEVLGKAALAQGDIDLAGDCAEALRAVATDTGGALHGALADYLAGRVALAEGEWQQAHERLHAALGVQVERGAAVPAVDTLEALGALALEAGDAGRAARILGAVDTARATLGCVRVPTEREWTRELCDRAGHPKEAAEGSALSLDDAIAWVRRMRGERQRPAKGWDSLTPVELQVTELVGAGLTNEQIGERLFMSRATVKRHLSHVFGKLGVAKRAELAAALAERRARIQS